MDVVCSTGKGYGQILWFILKCDPNCLTRRIYIDKMMNENNDVLYLISDILKSKSKETSYLALKEQISCDILYLIS